MGESFEVVLEGGDPKVDETDLFAAFVVLDEKDVSGFEVAMDNAFFVDVSEDFAELHHQELGAMDGKTLAFAEAIEEAFSFEVFHDEVKASIGNESKVGELDDFFVAQPLEGLGFALESLDEFGDFGVEVHDLDRKRLAEDFVLCAVYGTKAAFSNALFDDQVADLLANPGIVLGVFFELFGDFAFTEIGHFAIG